jgi:hypothetical protein
MQLIPVPSSHIDLAWVNGADALDESCNVSGGEITADQLKMILSRGERTLLQMTNDGQTVGWCVVKIDQMPNIRVLFVTDLVAHNAHFESFFPALADMGRQLGCSRVRCAAQPAQERLYRAKCGFQPVYSILEVKL